MRPSDPGYYSTGRKVAVEWPEKDPAPLVRSTDPVPLDAPEQRNPFKFLMRHAVSNGWEVRAGYSMGHARQQTKGLYKLVHTWGLWGKGYGWRWCSMHEWSPDLKADWAWDRHAMWLEDGSVVAPGLGTRFVDANVTDLRQFLSLNGGVGHAWFKGVHARVMEQAERQKARAKEKPATKKAKEGAS